MSKTTVSANVDVDVTVNVDVDASVTPSHEDSNVEVMQYVAPVALLGVAGAIAWAFVSLGAVAFVGLGGVVGVGALGFLAYDHLPDLLNDWHYRRLMRIEARRPVVYIVASPEEAKRLASNPKLLIEKR